MSKSYETLGVFSVFIIWSHTSLGHTPYDLKVNISRIVIMSLLFNYTKNLYLIIIQLSFPLPLPFTKSLQFIASSNQFFFQNISQILLFLLFYCSTLNHHSTVVWYFSHLFALLPQKYILFNVIISVFQRGSIYEGGNVRPCGIVIDIHELRCQREQFSFKFKFCYILTSTF